MKTLVIVLVIVAVLIFGLIFTFSLARTAKDADERMAEILKNTPNDHTK